MPRDAVARERLLSAGRRGFVVLICSYEVAAVATGRVPTITSLSGKHRALGPVLVLGLAVHLAWPPVPKVAVEILPCPDPV